MRACVRACVRASAHTESTETNLSEELLSELHHLLCSAQNLLAQSAAG